MKHLKKLSTSFMLFAALLGLAQGFVTAPPATPAPTPTPAPTKVENPGDFNFNFYATTNAVGFLLLPALALAAQIAHKGLKSGLETKNPEPLPLKELLKFSGKNMWSALKTSKNWKQPFADFAAIFTRPERSTEIQTRKEATKALTAHVLAQLKAFVAKNPGINASLVAAVINFAYSLKQKSNHTQAAQKFAAYTKALAAHTASEKLRIAAEAEATLKAKQEAERNRIAAEEEAERNRKATLESLKKTFYEIKGKNRLKSLITKQQEKVAKHKARNERFEAARRTKKQLARATFDKKAIQLHDLLERPRRSQAKTIRDGSEQAFLEAQQEIERQREAAAREEADRLRVAAETETRTRDAARAAQQESEREREAARAAKVLAGKQRATQAHAAQEQARAREEAAKAQNRAEQNKTVWYAEKGNPVKGNIRPGDAEKGTIQRFTKKPNSAGKWVTLDPKTQDYDLLHKLCYPEKPGLWAQGLDWLSSWRR